MESLSELLIGNRNLENIKRVATEMENAKRDFEIVYSQQLGICSQNRGLFEFFQLNLVKKDRFLIERRNQTN